MSPQLQALKLDPYDVKPISNPVDFVVFNGMDKKESVNDIMFLSKQINNPELNTIRKQVSKAISDKKYQWQTCRVSNEGEIDFE